MIDLRSDTVTKPTKGMRRAMANAEVGDDVFKGDPTVNNFQEKMAALFGFEAGLFVPSGVMGNQICLNLITEPGDEVMIDEKGHVFNYESTSAALISSVQLRPLPGEKGKLSPKLIHDGMRTGMDWDPHSKAVILENSTNKGGGVCYTKPELETLRKAADELGLAIHLDGARIWNAMEATGIEPEYFGSVADTMSVCFSKGLGAPVGSMIFSTKKTIQKARRIRKMLGGGMRQIGILAAAADYAVEHHRPFIKDDHRRTLALAKTVDKCNKLSIELDSVQTNILIISIEEGNAVEAVKKLEEGEVLVSPFGPKTLRATFHFQIDDGNLEKTQHVFRELFD